MDRYIGVDAHASSCTVGVIGPSGKRLSTRVVETNARALVEVIRSVPRRRHLCLEEGTLSGWLYEVLGPHVEEIVVVGVRASRGPKSDQRDAFGLAEQLRIGSLETRSTRAGAGLERCGIGPGRTRCWCRTRFASRTGSAVCCARVACRRAVAGSTRSGAEPRGWRGCRRRHGPRRSFCTGSTTL